MEQDAVLAMNQPSIPFAMPLLDYGGCYQSVSYDSRDGHELNLMACLSRPCFLIFCDSGPWKEGRDYRKPHSNRPPFLLLFLLLFYPIIPHHLQPIHLGQYQEQQRVPNDSEKLWTLVPTTSTVFICS